MSNTGQIPELDLETARHRIQELEAECLALREANDELHQNNVVVEELKQAEDLLKESHENHRLILESSPFGISIVSLDDLKKRLFVNGRMLEMFGYDTAEEMLNFSAVDSYCDPEDLNRMRRSDAEGALLPEAEMERLRKDGTRWWCHLYRRHAVFEGEEVIIVWHRDVTERKRTRQAMELAKRQAQEANQAKSGFLATMSHEIRTPLNGVLGIAQLLKDTELDNDQRKKVETILASGETLLAIISDVLDMSKIEAGGMEIENTAFSLKDLVATIATPFQSLADERGLKLRVTSQLDTTAILRGDPIRLRQILWNLLSNAIKFTKQGGVTLSIEQTGKELYPQSADNDLTLVFTVSDTGAGIARDRLGAIFDAFAQEDNSITRKFGGTGLGLSIVRQLTELMGGTIEVSSEVGVGTAFVVLIPFKRATNEEAVMLSMSSQEQETDVFKPLRVLVAEDNAVNAMIAKAFLEKLGHEVKQAENGREAVEIAAENWADLILMDIHMPEMDGVEATKYIRATEHGARLPIVGLTAEAFSERHDLFRDAGMNDVLTKPFTEEQLVKALAKHGESAKTGRS